MIKAAEVIDMQNGTARIDRVFPFSQIVEAHRYMESNEQIGKIVVSV
jgi:NADPH:quinone reductase-like Zn-dependent oxidoreductase